MKKNPSQILDYILVYPSKKGAVPSAGDRVVIKMPASHRYSPSPNLTLSAYSEPVKGDAMTAFKGMILQSLVDKLGRKVASPASLATLRDRLLDAADADKDGKVGLAEAKTIWALLRSHEFFVTFLFQDSDQIPRLRGFCGAAYAVDAVPVRRLYRRRDPALRGAPDEPVDDDAAAADLSSSSSSFTSPLDLLFPQRHLWGLPSWPNRARVGVGVLEFVSHIHAHDLAGSFFLCGTDETNVGYSAKHDAKFLALSSVLSKEMLTRSLTPRSCVAAQDCRLSAHCTTMCDESAGKCTGELVRPNLHLGCRILKEYLLYDAPDDLVGEMNRLFARCRVLESKNDQVDVGPTLLLNEIKSLLWKRISNTVNA